MARLLFGLGIAAVIFMVYAVADCAFFDRSRIRGLPRGWWIAVIIFVPIIGGLLWFIIGRGRASRRPVGGSRVVAPDDDADFLRRLGSDAAQEERIRRLEQELADLDDDGDARGPERGHPDTPETGDAGPAGRPNA